MNHGGAWGDCAICRDLRNGGSRVDLEVLEAGDPIDSWPTREQQIRIAALETARHAHRYPTGKHVTPSDETMLIARMLATGDLIAEWITSGEIAERTDDETGAGPADPA
jgi:hypothetical protein